MSKSEIRSLFIKKHILSEKSGSVRRPWNWKSNFDDEARHIFEEFATSYRSREEAWFCLCRDIELPYCPICGKNKVKFTGLTKNGAVGYNTTCEECSANAIPSKIEQARQTYSNKTKEEKRTIFEKRKATNKRLYGDENYTLFGSKSFKTNLKNKYGDEHYNNREQYQETCLDRYGVTTNLLIPEVNHRAVKNSWSSEVREKRIQNNIDAYGLSCVVCSAAFIAKAQDAKKDNIKRIEAENACTLKAEVVRRYGQGFKSLGLEYLKFGGYLFVRNSDLPLVEKYANEGTHTNGYVSKLEKEVLDYVKSICKLDVEENRTSVVPNENHRYFELDIFIPDIKLAIDFNGTYWHSTMFKDIHYHQRKTACCRKCGVSMLHVFEDQWKSNQQKCKDVIKASIDQTYENCIKKESDYLIVGDNSLPIFGQYNVVSITEPLAHVVGKYTYYDCGQVTYKMANSFN